MLARCSSKWPPCLDRAFVLLPVTAEMLLLLLLLLLLLVLVTPTVSKHKAGVMLLGQRSFCCTACALQQCRHLLASAAAAATCCHCCNYCHSWCTQLLALDRAVAPAAHSDGRKAKQTGAAPVRVQLRASSSPELRCFLLCASCFCTDVAAASTGHKEGQQSRIRQHSTAQHSTRQL